MQFLSVNRLTIDISIDIYVDTCSSLTPVLPDKNVIFLALVLSLMPGAVCHPRASSMFTAAVVMIIVAGAG